MFPKSSIVLDQREYFLRKFVALGANASKLTHQQFRLALLRRYRYARLDHVLASPFKFASHSFGACRGLGQLASQLHPVGQHHGEFFSRRAHVVDTGRMLGAQLPQLLLSACQVVFQSPGVPIKRPPVFQSLCRDRLLEVLELDARLG